MSQTTYTVNQPVAYAGMQADNAPKMSVTRALESAAAVEFGRPAVAGTDPATQFALPSAAAQVFLGITYHHHAQEDLSAASNGIVQNEDAELLRQGTIWVTVEEAIAAGDPVFYRHTVNGPLNPGGWRNDAAAGEADALTGAVYLTGAALGGLAKIQINIP